MITTPALIASALAYIIRNISEWEHYERKVQFFLKSYFFLASRWKGASLYRYFNNVEVAMFFYLLLANFSGVFYK